MGRCCFDLGRWEVGHGQTASRLCERREDFGGVVSAVSSVLGNLPRVHESRTTGEVSEQLIRSVGPTHPASSTSPWFLGSQDHWVQCRRVCIADEPTPTLERARCTRRSEVVEVDLVPQVFDHALQPVQQVFKLSLGCSPARGAQVTLVCVAVSVERPHDIGCGANLPDVAALHDAERTLQLSERI